MVCVPGGRLVFCQADGSVHVWDPETQTFERLSGHLLDALAEVQLDRGWDRAQPAFRHMWHPSILDPRDGTVLALVHHAGALVRISPSTGEVRVIGQIVIDGERGQAPSGSTSLTLCWGPGRVLYHIGTELFEQDGATRVRAHLLSHDVDRGVTRDHGRILTADGREALYAQTLAMTSDGQLASLAWVELPTADHARFFATGPAKIDVGISAEANPYEMRFLLMRPPAA
jgi:hypothetical protein